jgi:hypothetical protein
LSEQGKCGLVPGVSLPIRPLGIFFLQVSRISQHDLGQLRGTAGAKDPAGKSLRDQPGQMPAMIEVRVREHDGINRTRGHRERLPVPLPNDLETLKQAAVHKDTNVADLEQVFRSSYRSRRTQKRQSHANNPTWPPVCQNNTVSDAEKLSRRTRSMSPAIAFAV